VKTQRVVIPYARMSQIIEVMEKLPKTAMSEDELKELFGRSKIVNILPTLEILGLLARDRAGRKVQLTNAGAKFRSAIKTGDTHTAQSIIRDAVEKYEPLRFVKNLLQRKGKITVEEIGRELASKYNISWSTTLTYKAHGAACATIVAYAGYGKYSRGILTLPEEVVAEKTKLPPPDVTYGKIIKILRTIGDKTVSVDQLSKILNTKKSRLQGEIATCRALELVLQVRPGEVTLTEYGKELADPLNESRQQEIWRKILLGSRYAELIKKMNGRRITTDELAKILYFYSGRQWGSQTTVKAYAKKLKSWLRAAGLLEPAEKKGSYILHIPKSTRATDATRTDQTKTLPLTVKDAYVLGKTLERYSTAIRPKKL